MRTASPAKPDLSHLTLNDRAVYRCRAAFEFKDRGDYDGAQAVMRPLWKRPGVRPDTGGLQPSVAAEVLFCVGVLTGWIGSRNEIKEADEWARDLLTESSRFYESIGDSKTVAEIRSELAYCYWRAGALDEARIMFSEAIEKLTAEGNTRANALLGLSVVEWSACRYRESLKILKANAPLFEKITSETIKGFYHNQHAMVLRKLTTPAKRTEQLKRVIEEYEQADHHFKLARNTVFRAHVKNNIGNVLRDLSRYAEAHEYLDHARRLTVSVRDRVRTAQVDETRAQVFIAQRNYAEADRAAGNAAKSFEKAGRQCFLTDALITQGIALARLHQTQRAQFTFQRAIEIGHQAGSPNRAGLAALTMIEEIDQLPAEIQYAAYEQAKEWLATSQSQEIKLRFEAVGKKLALELRGEQTGESTADVLYNKPFVLPDEVLKFERELISNALIKVNGSITYAAKFLGVSYQRLGYILETRHRDLLKQRTPVRRRTPKRQ
ncbi:MAG: helix-turn-helix domain-containing protein [Pyrinomonadaceae bacterium]